VPGVGLGPAQGAGGTVVRIAAPGTRDAVVSVRLLGERGAVVVPGGVLAVKAGSVAQVALKKLDGIAQGAYAVLVEADVPVTAAVRIGRGAQGSEVAGTDAALGLDIPPSEFAWAVATPPLGGTPSPDPASSDPASSDPVQSDPAHGRELLVTVPALGAVGAGSAEARLSLTNTGTGKVVLPVRYADAAGKVARPLEVAVPPGATLAIWPPAGTSTVLLPRRSGVHAALVVTGSDARGPLISVLPVVPPLTLAHSSLVSRPDPRLGLTGE
jgi:hypothetical protein